MEQNNQEVVITTAAQLQAVESAQYDVQITTAKAYPRNILKSTENAIAIATMDKRTAETCGYVLPRGNKSISGPSVHLAKIIAQSWGNIRVEAKVKQIMETEVVSEAVCFDLENNYAVKIEVRRRITDKYGKRFKDDMITVTGNAANSIAYRNAVFQVIPQSVTDRVYKASRDLLVGDLSDADKLASARVKMIKYFKDTYNVEEEQICQVLNINTVTQIGKEHIITLRGIVQAIKDGDTSVADTFPLDEKIKMTANRKEISIDDKEKEEEQREGNQEGNKIAPEF